MDANSGRFMIHRMRRLLIGLMLALLLLVSIGLGVAVARWPHWR